MEWSGPLSFVQERMKDGRGVGVSESRDRLAVDLYVTLSTVDRWKDHFELFAASRR